MDISALRKDYSSNTLSKNEVDNNPITQFKKWFEEALNSEVLEPNAMTISTINAAGFPSARVVLLKGIEPNGFVFYTNYDSDKGQQLLANPACSLTFNWLELQRQVRIEGKATKLDRASSEAYFKSRPVGSQMGAHTSPQSQVIPNRAFLEKLNDEIKAKYADETDIPLPKNWGGFIIEPTMIEFWQGRPSRLHDRLRYTPDNIAWKIDRLAP